MKRVEDDFNKKYEEFLDGQKNFPKTILQKRQSELQEMLDKNIAFKNESQRMLNEMEAQLLLTVNQLLKTAVEQVGKQHGYAFILNTDADALPWLNPEMGEDVTEEVKAFLQ
jgi:outer membrane protein